MRLEDLKPGAVVRGLDPDGPATIAAVTAHGSEVVEVFYKRADGRAASELLYRSDEGRLDLSSSGRAWAFDGDGALFRLAAEAQRIRLAHLFDPLLAVHTSDVEPLPHQITAVYEAMLPRQPLRFLLADDPGAGKTIMAGLLIRELIARGDLERCLIVCPGSLAEQWQDELEQRFNLRFAILTNQGLEATRGNWFEQNDLVIARLDKLSRDEELQLKLGSRDAEWDLVVCDEAHKFSARRFGSEVRYTKRYQLGRLLSDRTRHFLLMTATPHNGKEEDFQLFMALLDGDRFEGRPRDGAHSVDTTDLMRRMVKEKLVTFDNKPLFPERIAETVPFRLSDDEVRLYGEVTAYVRQEFNRAEALASRKRAGTVGFALTMLQRRLASSPEAIYQSLRRRRRRLQERRRELETLQRGGQHSLIVQSLQPPELDEDDFEDLEDAPEDEFRETEAQVLDQATAARSIAELKAEIATLARLESLAREVRESGQDTKWRELSAVLNDEIFRPVDSGAGPDTARKLVLFTEHVDTLRYLRERIATLLGRDSAIAVIYGGVGREERLKVQESFRNDPRVLILLATDAAGEGINLQRAHLMVNYDLPWNPNRLEQRFGRIHRIGQTEVCRLWNLVAEDTREGDVYRRLLEKLEQAREALGGQVFDVLGKLDFGGRPLRDLLLDAIRYGERPEVRARLDTALAEALDTAALTDLLEERQLVHDAMDDTRVRRVRETMERAEARRLQPHYIESFFREAFERAGGSLARREKGRYEATRVPAAVRRRDRQLAVAAAPVLPRYERITFEKHLIAVPGKPHAAFVCPGHPLLDAVLDLTLEQHRDLLRRGTVLIDDRDEGTAPRVLFSIEHELQDGSLTRSGHRRIVSKRMLYIEVDREGRERSAAHAPYLDYRPVAPGEPSTEEILGRPECSFLDAGLEQQAVTYAVRHVVPGHVEEVREERRRHLDKAEAEVRKRLTREIAYWSHRTEELRVAEAAGKPAAKLNAAQARDRAENLAARLEARMKQIELDRQVSPLPPQVQGGVLVIPRGLLRKMAGEEPLAQRSPNTQVPAARARAAVMDAERALGHEPTDREFERRGYDIESRDGETGKLRLIEVKGRQSDADTITVTKNEVLTSLNKPDSYILALVLFGDDGDHSLHYVRRPFQREPDFGVTSANYRIADLLKRAAPPS
ncbi:MAG: DUF3883 domain-containing protein [Holophagales bacterium]|nr:DUF3883 domain-containing protein [Holophagales bacterium]MYG30623.1 DUF3883 domain-containing protein [Holophagales bacterium]MYI79144.1 DUF3883 domain-containing protein [Holophagales bacterium]